jgi:uncharacterized protein YutE (UPF0331/DUF86 family)
LEKSDRVRILSKLDKMIKYVEELQSMLPDQEEYQQDLIKRRACEKTIEVAIESLIDVSAMIVSAQQFGLKILSNYICRNRRIEYVWIFS